MTKGFDLGREPARSASMRGTAVAAICLAILLAPGLAPGLANAAEDDPYAVTLEIADLDPDALDAARRYFAMPSMQALSALRHDPRAIAHRFEKNLPENAMTADQRDAFIAIVIEEFSGMKEERDATKIRVLAHVYAAEELEAMIAFEQTEIGRRIAEKRPVYSVLVKDATASLRRDALQRVMERFTGAMPQ